MSIILWAIGSAVAVSLVALIAAIPLLLKKQLSKNLLIILLSISVGTLLATVSLHFLPEIFGEEHHEEIHGEEYGAVHEYEEHHEENNKTLIAGLLILAGFMFFFLIEKLIHYHHSHAEEELIGHGHAYHIAPINLIGDAVHNFIDGLIIAAAYIVSIPVGIAATISVLMHELPQELADMGVLLYAGLSKTKAVLYNLGVAAIAILGTIIGLLLAGSEHFVEYMLPFAAGVFIYTAASNLVPELHKECGVKDTIKHTLAILAGIGIMVVLYIMLPHAH